MKRNCDICGNEYNVKKSDLQRGWGLTCSKSCAAIKRENDKRVKNKKIESEEIEEKEISEYKTKELYVPKGYTRVRDVNGDVRTLLLNEYSDFR